MKKKSREAPRISGALLLGSALLLGTATSGASQSRQFNLAGSTVYDGAELIGYASQIALQRDGRVTASSLADVVETIYREDGYFLAEVFVGRDGRTLVVDEGRVETLVIEGVDEATFRRIRSYMAPVVGRNAVTIERFERAMMLVEDLGTVTATSEIDYPSGGGARVRIVAEETDTRFGSFTLENPEREFGEAAIATLSQSFLGVAAPGDLLRFELSGTTDFEADDSSAWGAVSYRFPFGGSGAYAEAYLAGVSARRDATGTLASTDIAGSTAIVAVGYPVIRSIDTYGYILGEIRRSGSSVEIPGESFDSEVDALGLSWIFGRALSGGGAYEYAVNIAAGQRSSAAEGFDDGDEDFVHLRFGAGVEQPTRWLGENTAIRAEVWGQYSPDRLPSVEEFYIGGRGEDRGYRFAEAQGDNGLSGTLEVSRDIFYSEGALRRLQPSGFLDAGWVKENDPATEETPDETFASLGIGLEAEFVGDVFVRSHVSVPLLDGPSTDAGDPSFYLGLTKSW